MNEQQIKQEPNLRQSKYTIPNHNEYFSGHPLPFIQGCGNRIYKKKQNCMVGIVGDTGSGKSYIGLKICEEMDPHGFTAKNLRKRCINNPRDFIELVIDKETDLKFGSALMFDEAGTGIPAREWFTFNNKAINHILQTFRYKRLFCVWTVPSLDLIDKQSRKFFNYLIVADKVDFDTNMNICKIFELSYAKTGRNVGKVYYKYPIYMKNGFKYKMRRFKLKRASKPIIHEYEKHSLEFKGQIVRDLRQTAEKIARNKRRGEVDVEGTAQKICENKKRYFKIYGGRAIVDQQRVELDFAIGGGYAKRIKVRAEEIAKLSNLIKIRHSDPEKRELNEKEKQFLSEIADNYEG